MSRVFFVCKHGLCFAPNTIQHRRNWGEMKTIALNIPNWTFCILVHNTFKFFCWKSFLMIIKYIIAEYFFRKSACYSFNITYILRHEKFHVWVYLENYMKINLLGLVEYWRILSIKFLKNCQEFIKEYIRILISTFHIVYSVINWHS